MKIFLFFGVCLFGQVISGPLAEIDYQYSSRAIESKFDQCSYRSNKTNFMDMSVDCILIILEDMHMYDLLTLAETNKNFIFVVQKVLRRRFAKKAVVFLCPFPHFTPKYMRANVEEFDDHIYIKHISFCTSTLVNFGPLISNLKILSDYKIPEEDSRAIFEATNFHCADNLTELHILNQNDVFMQFKKPFIKVSHVSLDGKFAHLSNSELTFPSLFPSITQLTLKDVEFQDSAWLAEHFPHLNHLTADINRSRRVDSWRFNETALTRLMQNNQQIRSLTLKFANAKLLKIVANELPRLEQLGLSFYDETNGGDENIKIHFEHLIQLSVNESPLTVPSRFTFGDLEEFETNGDSRDWIRIVNNNKKLKKLRIKRYMHNSEIHQLTQSNLTVVEMYFECGSDVLEDNIVKLIESCQHLEGLRVHTPWTILWHAAFDLLSKQFPNWNVSQTTFYIDLKRIH